jgi:arylsulfatase A-like enzyme
MLMMPRRSGVSLGDATAEHKTPGGRVACAVRRALAVLAVLASWPAAAAAAPTRPNVVVVMTDDQSVADLRAMPNVRTLLARRGTTFTNAFAAYPLCCPSRATYLTGQHAHNHGVTGNFAPSGYYGFAGAGNTLPVWLRRGGYRTAHVGRYLNHHGARDAREVPPGWDAWHVPVDFSSYDYFNYVLNRNGGSSTTAIARTRARSWRSAAPRSAARSARPPTCCA